MPSNAFDAQKSVINCHKIWAFNLHGPALSPLLLPPRQEPKARHRRLGRRTAAGLQSSKRAYRNPRPQRRGSQGLPKPDWLAAASAILGDGMMAPVDLRELAGAFWLSFESFRKKFTQIMGMSPMRYRTARAVDRASELLFAKEMSGKEIARQLGFFDEYHFSKRFKQITGHSPSDFRHRMHPTSEV